MIVEIDGDRIEINLLIFDSNSLQAWAKEDGKMCVNIQADTVKKIVVSTNE